MGDYKNEKDIERAISIGFLKSKSDGHGFDPIIASGKNAATLHYTKNNQSLNKDSLVLLDIGTKVNGYASDISRVWSIGGKPSKRQQEIWQACLDIQETAFSLLKPGVMMREYQKQVEKQANTIFKKLGCSMAGKPFPHGFSHFLGFDVHDAGDYTVPLEKGMVITVEPGIYLTDEGIGVRVEDDVLITEKGIKILSQHIPKVL